MLTYMCIVFVYCQMRTVTCHLPLQGLVHYSPSTAKGIQGRDQEGGTLGSRKSWQNRQVFRCCCCCPVPQLCPTLCYPMECSMPGFHVFHHLSSELAQTHVQWVSDAIQLSVLPLSSWLQSFPASGPSPASGSLDQVAKVMKWETEFYLWSQIINSTNLEICTQMKFIIEDSNTKLSA